MMKGQKVYFITTADRTGPVKIGYTKNPINRLMSLNCYSPYPLVIRAVMPGTDVTEAWFHDELRASWSHSEWFHPTPEVLAVMDVVASTGSYPGAITDGSFLGKTPNRMRQFRMSVMDMALLEFASFVGLTEAEVRSVESQMFSRENVVRCVRRIIEAGYAHDMATIYAANQLARGEVAA